MSIHEIEPGFTGSVSSYVDPEVVQLPMPFRVAISAVEDVTEGKVTHTYYDWRVTLLGNEVARRNVYANERPKTREAAVRMARKAIRNYAHFCLSNVHKR